MTSTVARPSTETTEPSGQEPGRRRRRWPWFVVGGVLAILAIVGFYVWRQVRTLTSAEYTVVDYTVPTAQQLAAGPGETVYRIDPTRSELSYTVQEKLFGQDATTAHGTTNGIAGDIAINASNPRASRLGEVVVNVEQLHSDNNLRDARLRAANLESKKYPLAYLRVGDLSGLPARLEADRPYHFRMPSQLTVRGTPSPVEWDVEARNRDGRLTATAIADVKMSDLGIGPISIAGLVSTSDDVRLRMDLTAVDPSRYAVPTSIEPPASAPRPSDSPSFERVVMPVLEANCVSCHQSGEVGATHWTVANAGDARDISDGIGAVVRGRYMPPWPASNVGVPLEHSKRLDQKTVDEIVQWARAGGPIDVPASTELKERRGPQGAAPRHDVVMKMPEGYAGSLSVPNDYRCFVLDPGVKERSFLTGYEVTPGVRAQIHHSQIFHIDAKQAAAYRARSGRDGKPGWSCYSSPNGIERRDLPGFTGQSGLIAGWVPGQDPTIYPQHSGIRFEPGDAIVLQLHYHYNETPVPDRSTVALQFEPGDAPVKDLEIVNPIAPVEIPCMPGQTAALCNRDAALGEAARLYGPFGAAVEGGLLGICGKTAGELAATFKNGVASSSCEYEVPADGQIVGVLGHMHTLGKTFRFTLDPGTPKEKVLLDIPTWNFSWQMNYELAKPIHVKAGQTLRMECSWDRTIEPNRAPKYIVFAEGTEDEMCFGTYGLIPDDQPQLTRRGGSAEGQASSRSRAPRRSSDRRTADS